MEKGGRRRLARAQRKKVLLALLRAVRKDAGLRQVDMAKALGEPQSFVSKYESGERRLDLVELHEVCLACKIKLTQFIRRLEDAIQDEKQ